MRPSAGRRLGSAAADDGCHRLDLDELIGVAEQAHADQRAGHVVLREPPTDHVPRGNKVLTHGGDDEDPRAHDVGERGAGVGERLLEIVEADSRLVGVVARSGRGAISAERAGPGHEEETTTRRHGCCVGVGRVGQ